MYRFSWAIMFVVLTLSSRVFASQASVPNSLLPKLTAHSKRNIENIALDLWIPDYKNCTSDQVIMLEASLEEYRALVNNAQIHQPRWKNHSSYQHYFNDYDFDRVKAGIDALDNIHGEENQTRWNFRCSDYISCREFGFETLDDWTKLPENLGLRREENKVQSIYPCSDYLNDPHAIPQINLRSVCGNMEQKLLKDFITMGHILINRVTKLDSFGRSAGFPAYPDNGFYIHGTTDWRNDSSPSRARELKTTKDEDKIPTWRNAESFAAFLTELYVEINCKIDDIKIG